MKSGDVRVAPRIRHWNFQIFWHEKEAPFGAFSVVWRFWVAHVRFRAVSGLRSVTRLMSANSHKPTFKHSLGSMDFLVYGR